MKQVLTAGVLLVVLLGLSFWSAGAVTETVTETETFLLHAIEAQTGKNEAAAIISIQQASEHWSRHEKFLDIFLRHDDVDNVIIELARLQSYAATVDDDDFLSNCSALLATLQHIRSMEWPLIHNIL